MISHILKPLCGGIYGVIGAAVRMAAVVVILPGLLLETAAAQTTLNSPARVGSLAKLPDWSGVWRLKGSPALYDVEDGKSFVPGVRDHPPYTAEWEAKYKVDLVRAEHQGDANYPNPLVDTHTVFCAAGMRASHGRALRLRVRRDAGGHLDDRR